VGLKNTDMRLKSIFGAGSGLRIRSNEWGYSVSFFIPFEDSMRAEGNNESEPEDQKLNQAV
jgi:hypothetical protein